jgi:hypothetical protein
MDNLLSLSDYVKDNEARFGPHWRAILTVNMNPDLVIDLPGVESFGMEHYVMNNKNYYIGPGYMIGCETKPGGYKRFYISKTVDDVGKQSDELLDALARGEGEYEGEDEEGNTYWKHNNFRGWSSRGSGHGLTLRGRGRGRGRGGK